MRRIRIIALSALAVALVAVPAAWALKISKAPPPNGFVGQPYYFDFQPEDNQGCSPYKWSVDSGAFPPGLSISSDDGIVTGTPTQVGTYQFFLELQSCAGNTTQGQFTITIEQKLTITSNSPLPDGAINQPYAPVQLTATGGTVSSWSIQSGSLPAGVTLSSAGVVSGTPTAAGTFEFVALAQGGGKSDTKRLRLTVTAPLVLGGPGGVPPKSEPVGRTTKVGAPFSWAVMATGGSAPYTYSALDPLPGGIVLGKDGSLTGTFTTAGKSLVRFRVTDAKGATDDLQVSFVVKALLAFATGPAPRPGAVGKAYSWQVPVTGVSKIRTFLASGAYPPGLSLDEATGVLSGTPLKAGSYRIKVWVLGDPGTQISKSFTIKVNA